jgi:hypothetical protein
MPPDEKKTDTGAKQAEVAADLEKLFRGAMKTATTSIEQYTDYAIKATKRVVEGEGDSNDWSKDAAELGALWIKDVSNAWSTWAQAVNLLAGRSPAGNDKTEQTEKGGG